MYRSILFTQNRGAFFSKKAQLRIGRVQMPRVFCHCNLLGIQFYLYIMMRIKFTVVILTISAKNKVSLIPHK